MIWSPLERLLYVFAIFLMINLCYLIFRSTAYQKNHNEKTFLYGLALSSAASVVQHCIIFLSFFFFHGYVDNFIFYGDIFDRPYIYNLLNVIFNAVSKLGTFLFVMIAEKVIKTTRYLLCSIIGILSILEVVAFFSSMDFYVSISWIISPTISVISMIVILWIANKANLSFLTTFSLFFAGYLFSLIGISIIAREVKAAEVFPLEFGPILLIIGNFIISIPFYIDQEIVLKNYDKLFKLALFSVLVFSLISLITGIYLFNLPQIDFFQSISYFYQPIIFLFVFFYLIKRKKALMNVGDDREEPKISILFSKPKQITEEEVTISKEKKTCLVCKGRIGGINFMCKECGAYYCFKCYSVLTGLENACWACETALDESKPVKLEKNEEEKVEIDLQKGKNK